MKTCAKGNVHFTFDELKPDMNLQNLKYVTWKIYSATEKA